MANSISPISFTAAENDPVFAIETKPNGANFKPYGCNKFCSNILEKIGSIWNNSKNKTVQEKSPLLSPPIESNKITSIESISASPLIIQEQPQPPSRIKRVTSAVWRCLNNPFFVGGVVILGTAGIVFSATLLNPVFREYSICINELNNSLSIACQAPSGLILGESLLAISSFLTGFTLQKIWEQKSELTNNLGHPSPIFRESPFKRFLNKVKDGIAHVQTNYSYESHLGLGFLYSGLWINASNQPSWDAYFNCQAAAIGIGSAFLGMYCRIQWLIFKQFFSQERIATAAQNPPPFRLKNHVGKIIVSSLAAGIIVASAVPSTSLLLFGTQSEHAQTAIEVCVMLLARPLGRFVNYYVNRQKDVVNSSLISKTLFNASILLSLQTPLVVLGYSIYLISPSYPWQLSGSRLLGSSIVGFSEGIKDGRYQMIQYPAPDQEENLDKKTCFAKTIYKIGQFIKNNWQTGALISFAIASAQLDFLDCNLSTLYCPISFEFAEKYIGIDGIGVNFVIIVGLVNYYARKLFRLIQRKTHGYPQAILGYYVYLTDKYQFDLLSSIPYAIFKLSFFSPLGYRYGVTYNPFIFLLLLGFTFGTYKEQLHARASNQSRTAFTDVGVLGPLI